MFEFLTEHPEYLIFGGISSIAAVFFGTAYWGIMDAAKIEDTDHH